MERGSRVVCPFPRPTRRRAVAACWLAGWLAGLAGWLGYASE